MKVQNSYEELGTLEQKVVIVGNSASGSDISFHVSQVCRSPLIISRRKISSFPTLPEASKVECPEIAEFVLDRRALCFADGRIEEDIDAVIFCTGYLYSYPFLASLRPPVVGDGTRVQNLYKHVFYIPRPTLAFVALPQKVVPFPVSESQAAVIARVWAGRLTLPSAELMEDWEKQTLAAAGGGKTFHYMNFPRDADYMQEFYAWSLQSLPEQPPSCVGKLPPLWGDKERWVRSQIPAIKQAYIAMGEGRHHVWDMEALGFNYEIA
jgi:cation diffusion facilitator CzcD-associated flavoprotein CzcO